MRHFLSTFCGLLLCSVLLHAQIIEFANPGFEGMPRHSKVPPGWLNCGPEGESPLTTNGKLVVFDSDAENQAEKVAYLIEAARKFPDLRLRITPYDARQHDGIRWECMSTTNGVYMWVMRE